MIITARLIWNVQCAYIDINSSNIGRKNKAGWLVAHLSVTLRINIIFRSMKPQKWKGISNSEQAGIWTFHQQCQGQAVTWMMF